MSPRDYEPVEMLKELRHLAIDGEPSATQREAALASLNEAIATEETPGSVVPIDKKRTRSWRFRIGAIAATAAAIAVVGGGLLATNQPLTATGMNEVVQVVEPIPPEDFSGATLERRSQDFLHQGFNFRDGRIINATQRSERVERLGHDGLIERVTTWEDPVAENPAEQDELMERWSQDMHEMLGVTTFVYEMQPSLEYLPETAEGWDEKLRDMYETLIFMDQADDGAIDEETELSYEYYALNNIVGVYQTAIPNGPQRAAMVNFLASIQDLERNDDPGQITFTADYFNGHVVWRDTATFDRNGWMIAESSTIVDGIPEEGVFPGHGWAATIAPWHETDGE